MSVCDFDVSRPRLIRDGSFLENDWREIAQRRRAHNRLGFAYQIAFVLVLGRFPQQEPLEIDGEILRFAALQLGTDPDAIGDYAEPSLREHLDGLLDTGDDARFSALNRIKESTSSPSVTGMRRLLARLELIEATDVLATDIGWVNGNYQRVLYHSVRATSADRLREMVAPRRRLALVCFLHQAWRDTLDQAVDMYAKLLDRSRKVVENRLDEKLKAQRHAVDRIVAALPRHGGGAAGSRHRRH